MSDNDVRERLVALFREAALVGADYAEALADRAGNIVREAAAEPAMPARDCPACGSGHADLLWREDPGGNTEHLRCVECDYRWSIRWAVVERCELAEPDHV